MQALHERGAAGDLDRATVPRAGGCLTSSRPITVVFFQAGSVSVEETTYFGSKLNVSANSPSRSGHAAAKPS